jgi:hypothetical protein
MVRDQDSDSPRVLISSNAFEEHERSARITTATGSYPAMARGLIPAADDHFCDCAAYQVRRLEYSFPSWFGESNKAGWPFLVEPEDPSAEFRIVFLQPNALNAGLRQGDTVLQINDRTIRGSATFGAVISRAYVGDHVKVTVRSNNMIGERDVVLGSGRGGSPRFVSIVGAAVMPVFCLALGFWVAIIRVRDPLA